MNLEKLADDYIDAWNRQDVDVVLALMHQGAAIYDAFWMETCVGRDLPQYLRDVFDEEKHWIQRISDVMKIPTGAVYRYSAHEMDASAVGREIYTGAEVLIVRDSKILTVSDFYCSPDVDELKEVGILAAQRHGQPSHTKSGLGALKMMRYRSELLTLLEENKIYLEHDLTMQQIAEMLGCSVERLTLVIESHFGANLEYFLDAQRVEHATSLLEGARFDDQYLARIADQVGFSGVHEFIEAFEKILGMTPAQYFRQLKGDNDPEHNGILH